MEEEGRVSWVKREEGRRREGEEEGGEEDEAQAGEGVVVAKERDMVMDVNREGGEDRIRGVEALLGRDELDKAAVRGENEMVEKEDDEDEEKNENETRERRVAARRERESME